MSYEASTTPELTPLGGDDDHIHYTQTLRHRLIHDMTMQGEKLPDDAKERALLLQAMADMDRTALANKKIGSKERTAAKDREAAELLARMVGRLGFKSPFESHDTIDGECREVPALKAGDLPAIELVPGETDIGISTVGYDEFMSKMEGSDEA